MTTALVTRGLQTGYGDIRVIDDATFDLEEAEVFAILGKNGSGKTTLLRAIMGLNRAWAGSLTVLGQEVTGWRADQIAGLGVSYAPQEKAFFPDLSVEENLRLGSLRMGEATFRHRRDAMAGYFPFIAGRLRQKVGSLSGGEQSMLKVARAILAETPLILLDEVSEGLQPLAMDRVRVCLAEESRRRRLTVVLVEQNIAFATQLARRYALIGAGRILEIGCFDHPESSKRVIAHLSI